MDANTNVIFQVSWKQASNFTFARDVMGTVEKAVIDARASLSRQIVNVYVIGF